MTTDITNISISSNLDNSSIPNTVDMNTNPDEMKMCSICLDPVEQKKAETSHYQSNVTGVIQGLCEHMFHIECFCNLNDDKCPLCRYSLSPASVTSCSLCSCEEDLWICLICGAIHCGVEGASNNHRNEHYINTGHVYAKGTGGSMNLTFDFSKNCNLNQWFQNSLLANDLMVHSSQDDNEPISKHPKEKVEFIMGEYNSIISSQLESQRSFYISLKNKIENAFIDENYRLEGEIRTTKAAIDDIEVDINNSLPNKLSLFEKVKTKATEITSTETILKESELEYNGLIERKSNKEKDIYNQKYLVNQKVEALDSEIYDISNQIKDLKIHINARNKIQKKDGLSEGSFTVISLENKSKRQYKKK